MDSAQAEMLIASLQGKEIGGWKVSGSYGKGKSAVVLPAARGTELAAIKVFHPELVERYGKAIQLERILREKSLVGASHPNLVQILDGGECSSTGYLFVVMERLPYSNIHDALQKIPEIAIPALMAQIASAARFLEDRGLAHRDIKPENIVVTDDFSRAILLDLGVLRPIGDSNLTDVDQRSFIGTLRYSSPEFLARKEEDSVSGWRAVTFYQLGAVLHDLLMKKVLFEEDSEPFSELVQAVKSKVPQIHAGNAKCVALANHCLIKNPATRVELVSWARFQSLDAPDDVTASIARDRIKQRQKYFLAATTDEKANAEAVRLTRRMMDDVCNRLESRIAALMNDLQSFPLRTTQSVKDVEKGVCSTCVHFEIDEAKGLPFRLAVLIRLTFLDENSGSPIYRGEASATLAELEVTPEQMMPVTQFHSGELQSLLDGPAFEAIFLAALDDAYTQLEKGKAPSNGQLLTLVITQGAT